MSGKTGKKKSKGTTLSLNAFLGNTSPAPAMDWAEESQGFDAGNDPLSYQAYTKPVNLSNLPTAPRSARMADIDMSNLPDNPPFTAFVGNLPYESNEDSIANFFTDLEIVSVRLIEEDGRFKGFGYVEFPNKATLAKAMQLNDTMIGKRAIRVDVAENKNQDGRYGNRRGGYGSTDDGVDKTEGEWRRKDNERPPSQSYDEHYSDRRGQDQGYRSSRDSYNRYGGGEGYDKNYRDRGYNRDRGYGDRDGYGQNRGYNRDGGYGSDRYGGGQNRDRDRGYGGGRDRGYGGDNRGYGGDRDSGYDRGYGGDRDRDYGGDRDRGYGGDRVGRRDGDRGYGDRRDGYNRSYNSGRYETQRIYENDQGRDSYTRQGSQDYSDRRNYSGRGNRDMYYRSSEYNYNQPSEPQSRPKLNLQPRTKPIEPDQAEERRSSSVFGGAKPVDTAAREREIEEKLLKEQQQLEKSSRGSDERSYNRNRQNSYGDKSISPRRQQSYDNDRERRTSQDQDHGRRISKDEVSPRQQKRKHSKSDDARSDKDGQEKEESPKQNFVPAPVPKQSVWGQKINHGEGQSKTVNQSVQGQPKPYGVREEAEGDEREGYNDRVPEGADNADVKRPSTETADGRESNSHRSNQRSRDPKRFDDKRRQNYDNRPPPMSQGGNRRRGDGGPGDRHRLDHDKYNNKESNSRQENRKRDSSRDSWPECDRNEEALEQDKKLKGKGLRPAKEIEQETPVDFVQPSKFAALSLEDDSDE